MISRLLFTAVLLASSAMAGPPLTTIQDVLYKADGTRFAGTLTISWTSFEAIDKSAIATQVTTVTVTGGNLWVQLVPTTTAVPAASYTVIYNSDGHIQFTETWAVPSSTTPLRIRDVRIAQTQTGAVSSDSAAPATQESDVAGLISDLGARPLKGPGYAAGRVAVVDSTGSLEGATGNPSDCVRVDGSTGPCGGSPPGFVDGESLSGTVDGLNTTYNLSSTPNPAHSLAVYRNGVLQQLGQDYTLNGGSVQFAAAAVPQPGDSLLASYRLSGSVSGSVGGSVISPQQIDPAGLAAGQAWIWNGSSYAAGTPLDSTVLSTWAGTSNLTTLGTLAAGTVPWPRLSGVPSTFAPTSHAGTHAAAGSDPVTPAAIGAVATSAGNQPNGYIGLDANGNASIGTTTIGSGQGVNVLGYGAKCDNATDDRVAIQAAITAAAGIGAVIFPEGRTCIISPVADHSKFLSLPAGTHLQGRATLHVKNGSAPYTSVLFANDCTGCLISDITIDSNVAGNPVANLAELLASQRWEIEVLSGSNITVRGITVKNTNSTNSVNVAGSRVTVADSIFTGLGDDPNHIVHDVSVLYLYGNQIIVTGNHFTGAYRGAPSAYTAIETHGSTQTVANNTITDMANGMNITGAWSDTSVSGTVTGNVITGALSGITICSLKVTGYHETGYGIDGVTLTGNTIRLNQLSYTGSVWPNIQTNYGINLATGNELPARNVLIADNVVVFDEEDVSRITDFTNVGIGSTTLTPGITYSNIIVRGNLIVNAPVKGIAFSADAIDGLRISGNTIRNAGQSLYSAVGATYKCPIFLLTSVGMLQGIVDNNQIIDDFATTRMTKAIFAGAAVAGGDLQILWNSVSLLGTTKTAFAGYLSLNDDNVKPLFRHALNPGSSLAWGPQGRMMSAGSQVYDVTTGTQYYLYATGTAWSSSLAYPSGSGIYPRGAGVPDWLIAKFNSGTGTLDSGVGSNAQRFGTFDGTTFTPKIILDPLNGVTSVPQAGTGQSFACWDATGRLIRSDTACR
jgi:hypothetical protein